jgi:hypothetical protein
VSTDSAPIGPTEVDDFPLPGLLALPRLLLSRPRRESYTDSLLRPTSGGQVIIGKEMRR